MHRLAVAVVFLLSAISAVAQNPPASDPFAISLVQKSMTAMGGSAIVDATLTGNASWITGSDRETGTVTFYAKNIGESRADLNLSGGTRTEIRNDMAGFSQRECIPPSPTIYPWDL